VKAPERLQSVLGGHLFTPYGIQSRERLDKCLLFLTLTQWVSGVVESRKYPHGYFRDFVSVTG